MARIVVTGGGAVGLCAAMLLAKDGHDVTVLERDPHEPPADPRDAWEQWERRGVAQFRLLHYLLPRFRQVVEAELPEVAAALDRAGALRYNLLAAMPASTTGGLRPDDAELTALTARRPVAEAAIAQAAVLVPGVTVRRGVAVESLLTGTEAVPGAPHVVGVRTAAGEDIPADVVVDATGRRSPLPAWITAAGGRPPAEEREDSGFVYYGRYFRSADGSVPPLMGPLLHYGESIGILTLPADNGTWGIGIIGVSGDRAARSFRDPTRWAAAVASFPLHGHWLDGEPIDDGVAVMAKLEDRRRRLVVDGVPVATGVLPLGDSWACTNPSVGRGISIGLNHALALRDVLRGDVDDPGKLAATWEEATDATVGPWYEETLFHDRNRLAEMQAAMAGRVHEPDPVWEFSRCLTAATASDPDLLRGYLRILALLERAADVAARPGVAAKAFALGAGWRDEPLMGPTREQVLAAAG